MSFIFHLSLDGARAAGRRACSRSRQHTIRLNIYTHPQHTRTRGAGRHTRAARIRTHDVLFLSRVQTRAHACTRVKNMPGTNKTHACSLCAKCCSPARIVCSGYLIYTRIFYMLYAIFIVIINHQRRLNAESGEEKRAVRTQAIATPKMMTNTVQTRMYRIGCVERYNVCDVPQMHGFSTIQQIGKINVGILL